MERSLNITRQDEGERLDVLLARAYPEYSRTFLQKWVREGGVTLRAAATSPNYRVRAGDKFEVKDFKSPLAETEESQPLIHLKSKISPEILFEDESLLVINKPAGLVVHPAAGYRLPTLIDWLRQHLAPSVRKVFTDPERLGLVHRLDKDTSGVLLIAKTITAQTAVSRQFRDRTLQKTYAAFVEGVPSAMKGVISAPVGRSRKVPTRMAVSTSGRASETSFEVRETLGEVSQMTLFPKTGRTHQIRVHLAAIGHPVVGDMTYGAKPSLAKDFGIKRLLLHAERLEILHPASGKRVRFDAPWPKDFVRAEAAFRRAAKLLAVAMLMMGLFGMPGRCEEGTTSTKHSSSAGTSSHSSRPVSSHLSSRISELSSEVKDLQRDYAKLHEEVAALQSNFDQLGAARRLSDMEHALAELNAKSVGGSAGAEETKTQILEMQRKLKSQQDTLEQLRDQLDRLQRQVIQEKAKADVAPEKPAAPATR